MKRLFSSRLRRWTASAALLASAATPSISLASGYDTPMLHTARHIGMAGTAISWVDDPSAMFHNPAGLGQIGSGQVMVSASPLMGQIQGCPNEDASLTADKPSLCMKSNPAASPFFLVGGAMRLTDRITAGFGVMPVGGAAGGYSYQLKATKGLGANKKLIDGAYDVEDSAFLSFIEFTPSIAVQIFDNLRLGLTWRPAYVMFTRERLRTETRALVTDTNTALKTYKDIALSDMKGFSWGGFRIGLQGEAGKLKYGAVFRNQSESEVKSSEIYFADARFTDAKFGIKYPGKIGVGVAYPVLDALTLAVDFEYILQSFNDITYLKGYNTATQKDDSVANKSNWQNSFTARLGAQWKFNPQWYGRVGYIYDSPAVRSTYPTAFGSPPAATHFGTIGAGYELTDRLSFAIAAAIRNGSVQSAEPAADCLFCGKKGEYGITLGGAYLDFVWKFGADAKPKSLAAK